MPPYQPHPPQYNHYNHYSNYNPHGHVRWPETHHQYIPHIPTTTTTTEKAIQGEERIVTVSETVYSTIFNDVINNVHDIVNQQLTTTETMDVQRDENTNFNIGAVFNETLSINTPSTAVDEVVEELKPVVTEIIETVQENITPTFPYSFEEDEITTNMDYLTTEKVEEFITTEQAMDTNRDTIVSTVRALFENDQGPNFHHGDHHGHHPTLDKDDNPYLILIIILSLLVAIVAVALFLYIRYKKQTRQDECSPISIVGKKFHTHSIFSSGEKPQIKVEKTGSTRSEKMETKPSTSTTEPKSVKPSSMKEKRDSSVRTSKMDSVEFEECPDQGQKINPR